MGWRVLMVLIRVLGVGAFWEFGFLGGMIICIVLDWIDGPIYKHVVRADRVVAQILDKSVDLWVYTVATLLVVWYRPWFWVLIVFWYLFRLVGQGLFLMSRKRVYLVMFPNMFEVFYLGLFSLEWLGVSKEQVLGERMELYLFVLIGLMTTKIFHEYALHIKGWTMFDEVISPGWKRIKRRIKLW